MVRREQNMSSNMAVLPFLRGTDLFCWRRTVLVIGLGGTRLSARRSVRNPLDRTCDALQRRAEIRDVDQGEQQSCDPEDMHVRKERDQAENGHKFELQLL